MGLVPLDVVWTSVAVQGIEVRVLRLHELWIILIVTAVLAPIALTVRLDSAMSVELKKDREDNHCYRQVVRTDVDQIVELQLQQLVRLAQQLVWLEQ